MNTNNETPAFGVQNEAEKLKSEILVGESVVNGARDKYAFEFSSLYGVSRMIDEARVQNKTYKLPKRMRKRDGWFQRVVYKIKIVLGLEEHEVG